MKAKITFFIALITVILSGCQTKDNIQESLTGKWQRLDASMPDVVITVNEITLQKGMVCTYQITDASKMHITRNWVEKSEPHHEAICSFYLKNDTLTISDMQITLAAIYPPEYSPITLKKIIHE